MKTRIVLVVWIMIIGFAGLKSVRAYYNPQTGRRLSRDPIGDGAEFKRDRTLDLPMRFSGFNKRASRGLMQPYVLNERSKIDHRDAHLAQAEHNHYGFVNNVGISHFDYLGLQMDWCCGYRAARAAVVPALHYFPIATTPPLNDDLQHCYVGCQIAKLCNQATATAVGVLAEIESLLRGRSGQAESRDILNTRYGAEVCGQHTSCRTCCQQARADGELDTR